MHHLQQLHHQQRLGSVPGAAPAMPNISSVAIQYPHPRAVGGAVGGVSGSKEGATGGGNRDGPPPKHSVGTGGSRTEGAVSRPLHSSRGAASGSRR